MEQLFYDIFYDMPRQGPGSKELTLKALHSIPKLPENTKILDVGCGTGDQSIHLANAVNGKVIAIDNYKPYVDKVNEKVKMLGMQDKLEARVGDMFDLDLPHQNFDIIWSEGALYIMGLKNALGELKKFIKPQGYFAVSDFNFLHEPVPDEIYSYFIEEVPDAGSQLKTLNMIKNEGFEIIDHFILPDEDWKVFYDRLENILLESRQKYKDDSKAIEVIEMMQEEIDLYRKYPGSYGYTFYIIPQLSESLKNLKSPYL